MARKKGKTLSKFLKSNNLTNKFKANTQAYAGCEYEDYIIEFRNDSHGGIAGAFNWNMTPEGGSFWSRYDTIFYKYMTR